MKQPTVFISYSHKDEKEKDALLIHLGVLQRAGLIAVWNDDRIGVGEAWENEITQAMARAKVAVLLVTANFLNSNFILENEVPALLRRCQSEGLVVFPVIAKACAWRKVVWLARMNVRPKNGRPVWGDNGNHIDEDLAAIAEEVADIVGKVEGYPSRVQSLWKTTFPKPRSLFAGPNYLCLATDETLQFLSPIDGTPLVPPLARIEDFSLTDYSLVGGVVDSIGNLLISLLPPRLPGKARLWSLQFADRTSSKQAEVACKLLYEAPSAQLSAPVVKNEKVSFIQSGPELVVLDAKSGRVQRIIPLPRFQDSLHRNCVSFAYAANYLCLALCDGTVLALDTETGQILKTLREAGGVLSPIASDGMNIFYGVADESRKGLSPSYVYAVNVVSGHKIWDFEMPPAPSGRHRPIEGAPLIIKDILYVTACNHRLFAFDCHTGQQHWCYEMPAQIKLGPVPIGTGVAIADNKGNIRAIRGYEPTFVMTSHYDLSTPPILDEWHPLIFTLTNVSNCTVHNTILRLSGNFEGGTENHTQQLHTISPKNYKRRSVRLKPTAAGTAVHFGVTVDYRYANSPVLHEQFSLSVPVRRSQNDRFGIREAGVSLDGRWRYNYIALQALLMAASTTSGSVAMVMPLYK